MSEVDSGIERPALSTPSPSASILVVDVSGGGGGGGISAMAFRMEVRSCRGVGREDNGADIFAGAVVDLRPFERKERLLIVYLGDETISLAFLTRN